MYKSKTSNRKKYTVKRVMYKIDEIDIAEPLSRSLPLFLSLSPSLFLVLSSFVSFSFIHSLTRKCARAHTHTHTHILSKTIDHPKVPSFLSDKCNKK